MGEVVELFRGANDQAREPVVINTQMLDVERFLRMEEIVCLHMPKLDDSRRLSLIAECMQMFASKTREEMIELVNNPANEGEWRAKPLRWSAVIAVLRLRRIAPPAP